MPRGAASGPVLATAGVMSKFPPGATPVTFFSRWVSSLGPPMMVCVVAVAVPALLETAV